MTEERTRFSFMAKLVRETEKALMFEKPNDDGTKDEVWLAKSQIKNLDDAWCVGHVVEVEVPFWLAVKEEWVEG